jgi:sulfonate transport system substrate-binding protein
MLFGKRIDRCRNPHAVKTLVRLWAGLSHDAVHHHPIKEVACTVTGHSGAVTGHSGVGSEFMLDSNGFEQACFGRALFAAAIFSLTRSITSLRKHKVFQGGTDMNTISRRAAAAAIAASMLLPGTAYAVEALKEIRIDWATYNPVSMVLKQRGLLEKEFAKDGIGIVWVQSAGSNKALEFLNAGSIDFGSTAGSAALVARINGNPIKSIYVFSRPEWTALVTTRDSKIATVADLKGKRVAVTRGTDPHIFLVRALLGAGLSEKDITPVLLQHADGKTALIRGDVDAWAGLDPMMAQAEIEDGARLFYRKADANTWGILNVREPFLKDYPDIVRRVLAAYEEARKYSLANYDDLKKTFISVTKLPDNVVDKQLKERTELTHSRIGAPQRESILAAGVALQQAGVIDAKVDVKAALDSLIDDQVPLPTN